MSKICYLQKLYNILRQIYTTKTDLKCHLLTTYLSEQLLLKCTTSHIHTHTPLGCSTFDYQGLSRGQSLDASSVSSQGPFKLQCLGSHSWTFNLLTALVSRLTPSGVTPLEAFLPWSLNKTVVAKRLYDARALYFCFTDLLLDVSLLNVIQS